MNSISEDIIDSDANTNGANKPPDTLMLQTKFSVFEDPKGIRKIGMNSPLKTKKNEEKIKKYGNLILKNL